MSSARSTAAAAAAARVRMLALVFVAAAAPGVDAWMNGVARTPPLGFSNWNQWQNHINTSLFLDVAAFMKDNGCVHSPCTHPPPSMACL